MEKPLCLFIFLCSVLLKVQCLECYVCDNCPKVKLDRIQTCGQSNIVSASSTTTTTESPVTTTVAIKPPTTSTSTTLTPTTMSSKAPTEDTIIFSTVTIEDITTLKTTTEIPITSTTKFITPASSPVTMETTNKSIISTEEPVSTSTDSTLSTSGTPSSTTESQTIPTLTETVITTPPISATTEATTSPTTTSSEPTIIISEFESESVISFITTTKEPRAPDTTLPEIVIVPEATFSTTEPTIENSQTLATLIEHNTESTIQNIPSLPILTGQNTEPVIESIPVLPTLTEQNGAPAIQNNSITGQNREPLANNILIFNPLTKQNSEPTMQNIPTLSTIAMEPETNLRIESAKIPSTSTTNSPESTVYNIRPDNETNETYNFRRTRSSPEDCECKNEQKCDCLIVHQRSKRYTLRGLGLSKEDVQYVCFVDKHKINETEIVKRGCAIKEEKSSCSKLGFGADCKICDTNQCNGAAILKSSMLILFSLYFI